MKTIPYKRDQLGFDILSRAVLNLHILQFQINLQTLRVRTLVGRVVQSLDLVSGAQFTEHVISSPWNLCLVSSDVIAGASLLEELDRDVLLIAMVGVHQIWALFLNKTTWWKDNK
jgi:hypothetical protein